MSTLLYWIKRLIGEDRKPPPPPVIINNIYNNQNSPPSVDVGHDDDVNE